MSCNYANELSPYPNKGKLGVPEKFDSPEVVNEKCGNLVKMIEASRHVVIHTGAGISTSAGIPDFRGPDGVWTLEKKGLLPSKSISFDSAIPSKTHMALKALVANNFVHYIITQNIDGLHLKSGIDKKYISELHGNVFIEQCSKCNRNYIRNTCISTVGQKHSGGSCKGENKTRPCRGGMLKDTILDWEHNLPEHELEMAVMHSSLADLNITLGTSMQINPSGNLPLKNKKVDGKLVICNLQPTKHDNKADLIISTYVDDILIKVCKSLGIEIEEYSILNDPTKTKHIKKNWTISKEEIKKFGKIFREKVKERSNKRLLLNSSVESLTKKEKKVAKYDEK